MLVLGRKVDEVVRIGDDISVRVVAIQGDQVKLGIDAPAIIPVHREEIYRLESKKHGGNKHDCRSRT